MNTDEIIRKTIALEGGYVFDSADLGGETKFGISKRSYPTEDILNLTIERATEIYKRDFFDKVNLGLLTNENVVAKVFDVGVNMGTGIAIRFLQQIIGEKEDGLLGVMTATAVNNENPIYIVNELRRKQMLRYADIVLRKPEQIKFFKGWINRAFSA